MSVNVYNKTEDKLVPIAGATVYADNPIGSIIPYGGSQLPAGWFICDGRSLSKNDYFDLWKVIGYNFGGSGSTFNLPDLRNKAVMGAGTNGALGASQLAQLPNITGKIDNKSGTFGVMGFSSGINSFNGALIGSEAKGAVYTGQQNTSACKVVTFDASHSGASTDINGKNVYKNNGETRPANVRCNFIIKAKHTPVPADFMDAVDDVVDELKPIEVISTLDFNAYGNALITPPNGYKVISAIMPDHNWAFDVFYDNNLPYIHSRGLTDYSAKIIGQASVRLIFIKA